MAFIQLEDLYGVVDLVVLPAVWSLYEHVLTKDALLLVAGKVEVKESKVSLLVSSAIPVAQYKQVPNQGMLVLSTGQIEGGEGLSEETAVAPSVTHKEEPPPTYAQPEPQLPDTSLPPTVIVFTLAQSEYWQWALTTLIKEIAPRFPGETPIRVVVDGTGLSADFPGVTVACTDELVTAVQGVYELSLGVVS